MTLFKLILSALLGLFVDDEFLAVAILATVAVSAAAVHFGGAPWAGAVLLIGCLLVVAGSLYRARTK